MIAHNQCSVVRLRGVLDYTELERAVREVVARHERVAHAAALARVVEISERDGHARAARDPVEARLPVPRGAARPLGGDHQHLSLIHISEPTRPY